MRLAGEISLRASNLFVVLLAAFHLAAFILPWIAVLSTPSALFANACTLVSAVLAAHQLRRQQRLALRLFDAGHAELINDDDARNIVLGPQSQAFAGLLIVMHWTELASMRRGSACLLRFCVSEADWRLLVRWLRWRLVGPARPSV